MSPANSATVNDARRAPISHMISRLSDFRESFNESDADYDFSEFVETSEVHNIIASESWYQTPLVVVVVGASGDLAKKKTYPALLELFENDLLPPQTIIWGYARSSNTHEGLRKHLHPYLLGQCHSCSKTVEEFLSMCFYHSGSSYGDEVAYTKLMDIMKENEMFQAQKPNILYYLAIPPNVFGETANTLEKVPGAVDFESTKFIIEKPFGRDLDTCKELLQQFGHFPEKMIYRIDHYLGKPMVDNIATFRLANPFIENMWSNQFISSVHITFKEPFGTQGRGGYFDHYGIIRDIVQNHLLQVLLLVAMELPETGLEDGNNIRAEKVKVLQNMLPVSLENTLLGQYDGYTDDETIKDKDTVCPTYVACKCVINTPRWEGVPFIMEAGKALDDRVVDVRVEFKNKHPMYPSNTLLMTMQPNPSISMTCNMKPLGLINSAKTPSVMKTFLKTDYPPKEEEVQQNGRTSAAAMNGKKSAGAAGPTIENAYTRLLMDVLRGNQANFVRDDELIYSWELFTPLLHQIERDHVKPESYKEGSVGPSNRSAFLEKMGVNVTPKATSSL